MSVLHLNLLKVLTDLNTLRSAKESNREVQCLVVREQFTQKESTTGYSIHEIEQPLYGHQQFATGVGSSKLRVGKHRTEYIEDFF